jgi:hypothetical protein
MDNDIGLKVMEDMKGLLKELIEKHGLDVEAWKDELNAWPTSKREMVFTLGSDNVEDAVVLTLNFIFSNIDLKINDPEIKDLADSLKGL